MYNTWDVLTLFVYYFSWFFIISSYCFLGYAFKSNSCLHFLRHFTCIVARARNISVGCCCHFILMNTLQQHERWIGLTLINYHRCCDVSPSVISKLKRRTGPMGQLLLYTSMLRHRYQGKCFFLFFDWVVVIMKQRSDKSGQKNNFLPEAYEPKMSITRAVHTTKWAEAVPISCSIARR